MRKILLGIILLLIGIPVYVYLSNPLLVTVNGTGEADAKPTSATVAFMISVQADTTESARSQAEGKAKAMESLLLGFGAPKTDIVKSQVTVAPSTTTTDPAKKFTATVSMGGKIADFTKAGTLVSSLYSNGAVYVSQPVLASENASQLESQAYDKAIANAASEASKLASQNRKLIKMRAAITQTTSGNTGSVSDTANMMKISKVVSVTYKMW